MTWAFPRRLEQLLSIPFFAPFPEVRGSRGLLPFLIKDWARPKPHIPKPLQLSQNTTLPGNSTSVSAVSWAKAWPPPPVNFGKVPFPLRSWVCSLRRSYPRKSLGVLINPQIMLLGVLYPGCLVPKCCIQLPPDDIYLVNGHVRGLVHLKELTAVETIWGIAGEAFPRAQRDFWPAFHNEGGVFTRSPTAFKPVPRNAAGKELGSRRETIGMILLYPSPRG